MTHLEKDLGRDSDGSPAPAPSRQATDARAARGRDRWRPPIIPAAGASATSWVLRKRGVAWSWAPAPGPRPCPARPRSEIMVTVGLRAGATDGSPSMHPVFHPRGDTLMLQDIPNPFNPVVNRARRSSHAVGRGATDESPPG